MTTANLALKFLLELAALAYWGASVNVTPAVAAPLAMLVVVNAVLLAALGRLDA